MLARLFPGAAMRLAHYRSILMLRLFGEAGLPPSTAEAQAVAPQRWGRWLKIVIGLVALLFYSWLFYLAIKTWDSKVFENVHFEPIWIILASLIQILGYAWAVYLRQCVLTWLGYPLPFSEHQKIYAYSDLAAKLPGIFWAYASRIYLYHRSGVARSVSGMAIGLEIMAMGVASSIVALVTLVISPTVETFVPVTVLFVALAICGALTHPRVLRFILRRFANPMLANALDQLSWRSMLFTVACYSGIIVMGGACLLGVTSSVVGIRPDLFIQMVEIWAITLVWGVIISWLPVDFGLRQGPLLVMFSVLFPLPIVAVILLLWRIWVNAIELMWGIVALIFTLRSSSRIEANTDGTP